MQWYKSRKVGFTSLSSFSSGTCGHTVYKAIYVSYEHKTALVINMIPSSTTLIKSKNVWYIWKAQYIKCCLTTENKVYFAEG